MPKVLLDAGHYGSRYNQGAISSYYESNMAWELQAYLKKALEAYGIVVGVTRTNKDTDVAVYNRGTMAKGYDLFVSLHSNACDTESVDRAEVYYAYDNKNNAVVLAQKLATVVGSCMGVVGKVTTRKSTLGAREYYGVLRGASDSGCPLYYIIEHSFHTNKKACSWLSVSANLERLAKAEAKVIAEHFGITQTTTEAEASAVATKGVSITLNQLSKGAKGSQVKNLQILLIGKGYSCGSAGADGDFGTNTDKALKKFQTDNGLDVDGICGKNTWTKLLT